MGFSPSEKSLIHYDLGIKYALKPVEGDDSKNYCG
jgi:hypothetical protein